MKHLLQSNESNHASSLWTFPWEFCWVHRYPASDSDAASDQRLGRRSCQLGLHTFHRELGACVQQQNLTKSTCQQSSMIWITNNQLKTNFSVEILDRFSR